MDGVRERLEGERRRQVARLAALTGELDAVIASSRDTNADDEHDPEGATIGFERAQVTALVGQVREHLGEVEAAVGRLDAGTYGTCERCGSPIGERRLVARPTARTCMACAGGRTTSRRR